jgi:hypothetical protein
MFVSFTGISGTMGQARNWRKQLHHAIVKSFSTWLPQAPRQPCRTQKSGALGWNLRRPVIQVTKSGGGGACRQYHQHRNLKSGETYVEI